MRLVPLAGRTEDAIQHALLSHGWEGDLSRTTSAGLESLAFHLTHVEPQALQSLVSAGARLGIDVITGDDWALLAGPRARVSALARPMTCPEPLRELAMALGHALPGEDPLLWQTGAGPVALDRPVIMGILNLTPDSFSDGGRHTGVEPALTRADLLIAGGAAILDVGGESTRPGAVPVEEEEELARVIPVLQAVAARFPETILSIDTTKSSVARAAIDAGATVVNDVSGLRLDPAMGEVVARRQAGLVLMHSRGGAGHLATEEGEGYPGGVLAAVLRELGEAIERARRAGVPAERIVVDPGLGFGKSTEHALELLRGVRALRELGRPILIGPSRKRFLGELTGRPVAERDIATAAACALGWMGGARIFRVHEPGLVRDALAVAASVCPR